jgi:hypothetical protein
VNYLEKLADEVRREVPPSLLPTGETETLFLLYALLVRVKGRSVTTSDVHDAWSAWMISHGRRHSSLVPFSALSSGAQVQDVPFVEAIGRVARRLEASSSSPEADEG